MNNLKKTKIFYDKRTEIGSIILDKVGDNEVIYGQRAINVQLPFKLRVYTEDYDIFAKNPRKEAIEVEKALDKFFGGNYFIVKPAKHSGTFRIVSVVDGKIYADYTKVSTGIPYTIINGKKYITLNYAIKEKTKILKNPRAKFRHAKDRDALNRIKLAQKIRQRRTVFPRRRYLDIDQSLLIKSEFNMK
jgi:hypothetical protein